MTCDNINCTSIFSLQCILNLLRPGRNLFFLFFTPSSTLSGTANDSATRRNNSGTTSGNCTEIELIYMYLLLEKENVIIITKFKNKKLHLSCVCFFRYSTRSKEKPIFLFNFKVINI